MTAAPEVGVRATVCVDLDSTLADTRHRQHMVLPEPDRDRTDWVEYSLACADDAPVPGCCTLVRMLSAHYRIVIVSARDEVARSLTEHWLAQSRIPYDALLLGVSAQIAGAPSRYKARRVSQLQAAGERVVLMIDDDPEVAPELGQLGVPTLTIRPPGDAT